jgi:LysM repeat protein
LELKKRPTIDTAALGAEQAKDSFRSGNHLEEELAEEEVIPGIPPRRAVHQQTTKPLAKPTFRWGTAAVAVSMLIAIGLWWFWEPQREPDLESVNPRMIEVRNSANQPSSAGETSSIKPESDPQQSAEVKLKPAEAAVIEEPTVASTEESVPASGVTSDPPKPAYERIVKHRVKPGETLYSISLSYYKTGKYSAFLTKHNRLEQPSDLISGRVIEIPFPPVKK